MFLEKISVKMMSWIGSVNSIIIHTIFFVLAFVLYFFGFPLTNILLVVTTIVSLEAIYLAIFIQMGVNIQSHKLQSVVSNVGEIQDNVEEIQENVGVIQENVGVIQGNVEEIQENVEEIQENVEEIQEDVEEIQEDVEEIQKDGEEEENSDDEVLVRIEHTIGLLMKEVMELKKTRR